MVQTAGSIMILGIGSFFDMKWKKIPSALFLAGAVWAAVCVLLRMPQEGAVEALTQAAVSLLPGAALLILSFMTEKKVGAGDGLTLLLLGLYEGMELALGVFCLGLFLQSLLAVVLLVLKKADKQSCIPFLPFLLAARLVWMGL